MSVLGCQKLSLQLPIGCRHVRRVFYDALHPVHKVGHVGIYPIIPRVCTAPPPADHACQEVGGAVERDQWAPVVPSTTLLMTLQVSCTQHVVGEVELGSLGALGVLDDGDRKRAEDWGDRGTGWATGALSIAPDGPLAPAGHGVVADQQELPLDEVFGWQADRDGMAVQGHGSTQLQQGNVAVTCRWDITFMGDHHGNRYLLFCALFHIQVVFP